MLWAGYMFKEIKNNVQFIVHMCVQLAHPSETVVPEIVLG